MNHNPRGGVGNDGALGGSPNSKAQPGSLENNLFFCGVELIGQFRDCHFMELILKFSVV